MANNRRGRETPEERAQRDRMERVELLKMKQGLIEESEMIPETGYAPPPEQGAWGKFSSFMYRNKVFVVIGAFLAAIAIFLVVQLLTREKDDIRVMLVSFKSGSDMELYAQKLESALEMYCPDFDGNGKVHVTVNYIDRTGLNKSSQYDDIQTRKFNVEFELGEAQLIITDEQIIDWASYGGEDGPATMHENFLEQTDAFPEDELYYGCGIRANKTPLAKAAGWSNCPDNIILLIRDDPSGKGSNAENRERVQIVLQNILDDNIINPAIEE